MRMRAFSGALITCSLLLSACTAATTSLTDPADAPRPVDAHSTTPFEPPNSSPSYAADAPSSVSPGQTSDSSQSSDEVIALWVTATFDPVQQVDLADTGDQNTQPGLTNDAAPAPDVEADWGCSDIRGEQGTPTMVPLSTVDLHNLPGLAVTFTDRSPTPQPAHLWHAVPLMALSVSQSFPRDLPQSATVTDLAGKCFTFTRQQLGQLDLHLVVPAPSEPLTTPDRDPVSLVSMSSDTFPVVQPVLLTWTYPDKESQEACRGCD